MNDKVTLQAVSDIFSRQYGISKKTTDAFCKSFFDTIVDGLNAEGQVKIKGLGTFRIVEVGSRESVNVTNGERIVIDGYRKVAFVPDELSEMKQQELNAQLEQVVSQAGAQAVEDDKKAENIQGGIIVEDIADKAAQEVNSVVLDENVVPENVEVPADEFSGIDMLISTPESIEEVQKDLKLAQIRAEQTLEEAKLANVEYRRLEALLERLMANGAPEVLKKASVAASAAPAVQALSQPLEPKEEAPEQPEQVPAPSNNPTPEEAPEEPAQVPVPSNNPTHEEALKRYLSNGPDDSEDETDEDDEEYDDEEGSSSNGKLWIIIPLVGILLAAISIFAYRYIKYNSPFETEEPVEEFVEPEDTVVPPAVKDTTTAIVSDITEPTKEMKEAEAKAAAEKKAAEEKAAAEAKAAAEKKAAEEKAAAEAKANKSKTPKTYTIAKGESLTRISQKFYNTKDSVNAIIRLNNFPDPNNVPIGSVIKLP